MKSLENKTNANTSRGKMTIEISVSLLRLLHTHSYTHLLCMDAHTHSHKHTDFHSYLSVWPLLLLPDLCSCFICFCFLYFYQNYSISGSLWMTEVLTLWPAGRRYTHAPSDRQQQVAPHNHTSPALLLLPLWGVICERPAPPPALLCLGGVFFLSFLAELSLIPPSSPPPQTPAPQHRTKLSLPSSPPLPPPPPPPLLLCVPCTASYFMLQVFLFGTSYTNTTNCSGT